MSVDIIDPSFHLAAFPSGNLYTGPGTLIGNCVQSGGDETDVHGYFTSDGNAVQVNIGFRPMRIKVIDTTDNIQWDWMYGFPATNSQKTVGAGTVTQDTGSAIVPTEQAGTTNIAGNWIVTFSATLAGTSKNICFHIEG